MWSRDVEPAGGGAAGRGRNIDPFRHGYRLRQSLLILIALATWGCRPAVDRSARVPVTYSYEAPEPASPAVEPTPTSEAPPPAPPVHAQKPPPEPDASFQEATLRDAFQNKRPLRTFRGRATYYHDSLAGNLTACGEPYTPSDFTAAHPKLAFGTILRVTHPSSGRTVYVRVNDRGPHGNPKLVLDLSRAAAEHIGLIRRGVMDVRVEVLEFGDSRHGRCGHPPK